MLGIELSSSCFRGEHFTNLAQPKSWGNEQRNEVWLCLYIATNPRKALGAWAKPCRRETWDLSLYTVCSTSGGKPMLSNKNNLEFKHHSIVAALGLQQRWGDRGLLLPRASEVNLGESLRRASDECKLSSVFFPVVFLRPCFVTSNSRCRADQQAFLGRTGLCLYLWNCSVHLEL